MCLREGAPATQLTICGFPLTLSWHKPLVSVPPQACSLLAQHDWEGHSCEQMLLSGLHSMMHYDLVHLSWLKDSLMPFLKSYVRDTGVMARGSMEEHDQNTSSED